MVLVFCCCDYQQFLFPQHPPQALRMSINRISVQTSMQPFIPLPHPHPQRSNKIIIQQQLFPQKEPPPQPLFPKKFMCISFIFLILCDFPLCHFYLFCAKWKICMFICVSTFFLLLLLHIIIQNRIWLQIAKKIT